MQCKTNKNQAEFLKRRKLDPKDYVVVKVLYGSLWVRNIHTGAVKILDKKN